MAAVIAVALLLLCGNVHSAEEEVLIGYVTQVRTAESNTSSTAPVDSPATAPAISSPTGESGGTRSAVLSALPLNEKSDVMLVDLARADDEQMINMTSSEPPESLPGVEAIPEGFDMVEADAPSTDPEASVLYSYDPEAPGPVSSDSEAPGPDSALPADEEQGQGTLVSDVEDTNYPNIRGDEDNSYGESYGVQPSTVDDEAQSYSLSAYAKDPSEGGGGFLISDADDSNYPNIRGDEDNSYGESYGVQPSTVDDEAQSYSLSAYAKDPSEGGGGFLISDADDSNYPNIRGDEDNSYGESYGVQPSTVDDEAQSYSLSAYAKDPSEGGGGFLISDADDSNYPNIRGDEDNSYGESYGVQPSTVDDEAQSYSLSAYDETQGDSYSTYVEDSSGSEGSFGTLISDPEYTNYPTILESEDQSTGDGYGVGGEDSVTTQDEDGSESSTSGVALMQSRTYSPPSKPKASWSTGKCTYYGGMDAAGTMSGACGYGNLYASGYGAFTAALSSALFKNGMACGACYEVACSGKACKPGSVQVTATNFCPPNPGQSANNGGWCNGANPHFDLSYPAFAKIADPKAGVVDLKYRRVPCKKKGGVRYTLNGNCNFNLVTITNVGGSGVVTAAYMKADGMAWASLSRTWGANWQCSRNYCGKAIYIKIVTSDKKVSVSKLAGKDWAFGKTYIGQQVK